MSLDLEVDSYSLDGDPDSPSTVSSLSLEKQSYCASSPVSMMSEDLKDGPLSPIQTLGNEELSDSYNISRTEAKETDPEVLLVDADTLVAGNDFVVLKMEDQGQNPKEVFLTGKMMKLADGSSAFIQHTKPGSNEIYTPIKLHNDSVLYILTSTLLDAMGDVSTEDNASVKREKNKGFSCPYENCTKSYSSPHHLKVHTRAHTGDRPFKCTVKNCNKAFSTAFGLKTHRRTHNNERPYSCQQGDCVKRFKTSGDLQKHIRTHTGERPFLCPVTGCGRTFTTGNICKVHVRTHTGERPYRCTYPDCFKTFASLTNQRNHSRIHSGERPYICPKPECGRKFTEYSSLYKHNQVHRQLTFHCHSCSNKYRTLSNLNSHIRSVHRRQNDEASEGTTSADVSVPRSSFIKLETVSVQWNLNNLCLFTRTRLPDFHST